MFSGVPYFYMNGIPTFSGAQDVNTFVKMFDTISKTHPLKDESNPGAKV